MESSASASSPPASASASTGLAGLVQDLLDRQESLKGEIDQNQAELASDRAEQRQVQADLDTLQRAANDVTKARAESTTAIANAEGAVTAAADLIDGMKAEDKQKIADTIDDLDQGIADKQGAVNTATDALAPLLAEQAELEAVVDANTVAVDQALSALSGLPGKFRELTNELKKYTSELTTATAAGKDRKAYVLTLEIDAVKTRLKDAIAAKYESDLVAALTTAQDTLTTSRTDLVTGEEAVTTAETELAQLVKELVALRAARKDAVKQLFVAPPAS